MSDFPPSITALLVEDEAYFRKFVGQVLRNGLIDRVVEGRDGIEGVRLFKENNPGLVLLDINMPRMNGLETLAALRRLSSTVPIIMLTSVSDEKIVEECVHAGATFFIRKDVSAGQLNAALHEALAEFLGQGKVVS